MRDGGGLAAYVDESGSRGGANGHFVLACVAGDARAIARLSEGIRRAKLALVPGADPGAWEMHAREIMHGAGPLRPQGMRDRVEAIRMAVGAVCESGASPVAIAVRGPGAGRRGASVATRRAVSLLVARLECLAAGLGEGARCRIVSDSVRAGHLEDMERALARASRGRVTGMELVDSRSSDPVQAADSLAYAVGRHLRGDARFGEMFAEVERCAWLRGGWGGVRVVDVPRAARKPL